MSTLQPPHAKLSKRKSDDNMHAISKTRAKEIKTENKGKMEWELEKIGRRERIKEKIRKNE